MANGAAMTSNVGGYVDADDGAMYLIKNDGITIDLQNRIGFTTTIDGPGYAVFAFTGKNQSFRNFSQLSSGESMIYVGQTAENLTVENGLLNNPQGSIAAERAVVVVAGAKNTTFRNVTFDNLWWYGLTMIANGTKTIEGLTIDRSTFSATATNNYYYGILPWNAVTVNNMSVTNTTFKDWNTRAPITLNSGTYNNLSIVGNTFLQTRTTATDALTLTAAGSNQVVANNLFKYSRTGTAADTWVTAANNGLTIRDNHFQGGARTNLITANGAANTIKILRNTADNIAGFTNTPIAAEYYNNTNQVFTNAANGYVRTVYPSAATIPSAPVGSCVVNVTMQAPQTGGYAPTYPVYVDAFAGDNAANGGDDRGLEQYLGRVKVNSAADFAKTVPFAYSGGPAVLRLQTFDSLGRSSQYSRTVAITGSDTCAPEMWIKQGTTQEDATSWRNIVFEVQSSEPLGTDTLTASDITFASGSPAGSQVVGLEQISSTRWNLTVKANASGTITPAIAKNTVNDRAGNKNTNPANTKVAPINFAGAADDEEMTGVAGAALDNSVTYNSPLSITLPNPRSLTVNEAGDATQASYRVQIVAVDPNTGQVNKAPMDTVFLNQEWTGLVKDSTLPTPKPAQAATSVAKTLPTNEHLSTTQPTLDTIQSFVDVPVVAINNAIVDGTRSVTLNTSVDSTDYEYDELQIDMLSVTVLDDDAPVASASSVSTKTNNALANGSALNTVQAVVKNAAGVAVSNATVTFTLPAGVTYTPATGTPVAGPGTVTVETDGTGTAALPLTSLTGNKAFSIAAAVNTTQAITGSPASVIFTPVPVDTSTSSFSVSTGTKAADNTESHTLTVKLSNQIGSPAGGFAASITAAAAPAAGVTVGAFTEGEEGTYTAPITSTTAGTKTITVTVNNNAVSLVNPAGQNTATFVAGAPQVGAGYSSLALSTATKIANNVDKHTATVTLKDANGNPVTGKAGALTAAASPATNVTIGSFVESSAGVYAAPITSKSAGAKNIAVVFDAAGLNLAIGNGSVTFVPGAVSANSSSLTVSTGPKVAGVETHEATVLVTDAQGNPVAGQPVVFTSGATMVPANGTATSGADGVARVTLSSNTAGQFAVDAAIGGNAVTNSPGQVSFVAGGVSFADNTTRLSGTTGSIAADGAAEHTATVTVTDAFGNPVKDAQVVFAAATQLVTSDALTQLSDENGQVFLNVTSRTAGTFAVSATVNGTAIPATSGNPQSFTYKNGAASATASSWTVTPDGPVTANGTDSYTATVTVQDSNDNPVKDQGVSFTVPTGVTLTETGPFVSDEDGEVVVHFTSTAAGEFTVSAHIGANLIGEAEKITFKAGDVAFGEGASTLDATTGTQQANGTAAHTATVVVRDEHGNPVKDASVAFAAASPATVLGESTVTSNAEGIATVQVVSSTAGTFNVTATVNGTAVTAGSPARVTFVAGAPSAGASTFTVTPTDPVAAEGEVPFYATVTVTDAQGNPVEGVTVGFEADAVISGARTATTNADGVATTELTSTKTGIFTVRATIGSEQVGNIENIEFNAGAKSQDDTNIQATTGSKLANGVDAHTVTVTVVDLYGNPIQHSYVTFNVEGDATAASPTGVQTNADGQATLSVTSNTAGTFTVTAKSDGEDVTTGSPARVTFVAGDFDVSKTTLSIPTQNDNKIANTVDEHIARVTVLDENSNPIEGLDVVFAVEGDTTFTPVATTNANGVAETRITSAVAQTATVTATIGGETVTDSGQDIVFVAGAASAEDSTFSVSPGTVEANGSATHYAQVIVKDAQGNLVEGATVDFTVASGATAATTATTDEDGVARVLITSKKAGGYTVSGSIGGTVVGSDSVQFVSGAASASTSHWTVTPEGPVAADGSTSYKAVITVNDAEGNPVKNAEISLDTDTGVDLVESGPFVSANDGTVTVHFTSTVAGEYSVSALLGGNTIGSAQTIEFVAGPVSLSTSTIAATPALAEANGTQRSTVIVSLLDVNGNPVLTAGDTVTITTSRGVATSTENLGDGTYRAYVTSLTAGGATVGFTVAEAAASATDTVTFVKTPIAPSVNPSNGTSVSGVADPGAIITVTNAAGETIGTAVAGLDGVYSVEITESVANGETITVVASDINGFESAPVPVVVDAVAPAVPTVNPSNGSVVYGTAEPGSTVTIYGSDNEVLGTVVVGEDGTYEFTFDPALTDGTDVRVSATDAAGNESDAAVLTVDGSAVVAPGVNPSNGTTIGGTGVAGDTITVTLPNGDELTALVGEDGTWSITPPAGITFEDGDTITVTAENGAGTVSPPTVIQIDKTAPAQPAVNPSNGTSITGGPVESGATVSFVDGAGNPVPGTVTVDEDGYFVFTPSPVLTEDSVVKVVVTDAAGNPSEPLAITVDATAPEAPSVNPTDGSAITGTAEKGATVTVTNPETGEVIGTATVDEDGNFVVEFSPALPDGTAVTMTVTDPAGNPSGPVTVVTDASAPAAPVVDPTDGVTVTGTAEKGATVTVTNPETGEIIGTATVDEDGTFVVTFDPALPDGTPIEITVTDPAGNASEPVSVTTDGSAPEVAVVNPTDGSTVTGTAEKGATVTVTNPETGEVIGTATVDEDGTFVVTLNPALPDGTPIEITVTDPAGNSSAPVSVVTDGSAPAAPSVDPTDGSTVTGTAEKGATVTVTNPETGEVIGTATVDEDGTFVVTLNPALPDGTPIEITVTDPAGNASEPVSVTTDGSAPEVATVNPTDGSTVTGTAEKGATVTVTNPETGEVIGTATVDEDGTFAVTLNPALPDGTSIEITVTDPAGNSSAPVSVTTDGSAPVAPVVDPTDGVTVTGTAEKGATVTVTNPETGEVIGTATVDEDGTFVVTLNPALPDGTPIEITVTDPAGNASEPITVVTDASAPEMATVDPTDGSTVTGTAEKGATVTVTNPETGEIIGTATVDEDGTFVVTLNPALPDGTPIEITVTDPAGNASEPVSVVTDASAPAAPTVAPSNGTVVYGTAEEGSTVNIYNGAGELIASAVVGEDGTYSVNFDPQLGDGETLTVSATDPAGNESPRTPLTVDGSAVVAPFVNPTNGTEFSGTGEAGSTITVTLPDNSTLTTTVGIDGTWSITPPAGLTLEDGDIITVTQTNPAGTVSPPTVVSVDRSSPEAPVVNPTDGSEVTGTGEEGSTVTITNPETGEVVCTTTIGTEGTFTCVIEPALPDGTPIEITVTDPAGNPSEPVTVVTDSSAPAAPVVNPTDGSTVSGTSEKGGTVTVINPETGELVCTTTVGDDGTFTCVINPSLPDGTPIEITVTDPAGNVSEPVSVVTDNSAPAAPVVDPTDGVTVTGTAEKGATVTVTNPETGEIIGTATVDEDGTFVVTFDPALPDGTPIEITVTDPAGNASEPVSVTTDGSAPEVATVNPTDGSTVTGAAEKGATVTVTNPETGEVIGTATVDEDGTFVVTLNPALPDGTPIEITVTDPAGNASEPITVVTDASAPEVATVDASNGKTVTGSNIEKGAVVTVTDGNGVPVPGTMVVHEDGTFVFTPTTPLAEGSAVTVTVTDAAGNSGTPVPVVVDTTPPTAPKVSPSDGTVITGGPVAPGDTLTVVDGQGNPIPGTTVVDSEGNFTFTPDSPLAEGDIVKVVVADAVGNTVEVAVSIDTTKPTTPVVYPSDGSTVTGCAEAGSTVTITDADGNTLGTAVAGDDCHFEAVLTPAQEKGVDITIVLTDPAGNESEKVVVRVGSVSMLLQSALLRPGTTQVAYGYGFQPGEVVTGVLHSEPIALGSQVADANGEVTFTIALPGTFELGSHSVILSGAFSGEVSETFMVTVADAPTTPAATPGLAVTGSDILMPLSGAFLLVAAGAWFLVAKRRRENTDAV
ncbi:hypothetical protein GCM10022198_11560 [Klugiella xanthotipulae]